MNLSELRIIFTIFGLWVWLSSCSLIEGTDKIIGPEWSPEVALPLVNTHISVQDALDLSDTGDWLEISAAGDLTLIYDAGLATLTREDLQIITIPDIPVVMTDSQMTIPFPIEQLRRVVLKTGTLVVDYQSGLTGEYEVNLRMDYFRKGGIAFSAFFPLPPSGIGTTTFDLAGYALDMENGAISFSCYAHNKNDGLNYPLDQVNLLLKELDYSYVEGTIPANSFESEPDSIKNDIFEQIALKGFSLTDPSITFRFDNSFGVPIEITSLAWARGSDGITTIPLGHDGLAGGVNLGYPSLSEVGAYSTTDIILDRTNSNITDIISALPEVLTYQFGIITNPSGNAPSGFITDSSSLSVGISARVPLEGKLEDLVMENTFEADLSDLDIVASGGFKLITENALPVEVLAQIYFLDSQGVVIDSLFEVATSLLPSPSVGINGAVVAPGSQTLSVIFSEERFAALSSTREVRIRAEISTAGGGQVPVKFQLSDSIDLKLGVIARIKI
ncbi:MAG: hypothetical protein R3D00_30315 [Bacteroidia bacterium]